MSRSHFEQLPEPRKTKILVLAAEQFAKDGFQGTSYNQLLTRLGLGKGSAYYYFADKQDLFLTVVRECYQRFFQGLSALQAPTTASEFWAYVETMNRRGLDFMVDDPTAAAVLVCFRNERGRLDLLSGAELFDSVGKYYQDAIRLGQRLGAVRRDLPLDLLVLTTQSVAAACDQWFVENPSATRKSQRTITARRFTDLMRRVLEAEAPRERAKPKAKPRAR